MKRYIYILINYQQNDLLDKLSIAKFAANDNNSSFTKLSPFFLSKDLYLYMSFDIINFYNTTICQCINKNKAIDTSKAM